MKKEFNQEGIIYTGHISDEELVALYKNAEMFVMPSFEEGFGIPLLESMVCSCPIVSSDAGALKEVGGDACLYFDPYNNEDMTDKIGKLLKDQSLKNQLIEKGQKRVKQFSWEKVSDQFVEFFQQVLEKERIHENKS